MNAHEELRKIQEYLNHPENLNDGNFQHSLDFLGSLVNQTIEDQEARSQYSENTSVWTTLLDTIESLIEWTNEEGEILIKCSRLYRGLLLLIRNLIVERSQNTSTVIQIILSLQKFGTKFPKHDQLYEKTIVVYLQILANCQYHKIELESEILVVELDRALTGLTNPDYSQPMIFLLHKFFKSEEEETNHNINLYNLLRIQEDSSIVKFIFHTFQQIDFEAELPNPHQILLSLIFDIITHESFENWLLKLDEPTLLGWLQLGQLLITSRLDWNNYQLIALMSWSHSIFKIYSSKAIKELRLAIQDTEAKTEDALIVVLDIITDMCQYNQVIQFLIHYNVIEPLISLLGVIHQNIKPLTIKDREKLSTPIQQRYPQTKSLIIEIISYMTHDSFDIQEKVRLLHGLELILSNCIIDENNPFVKERSIMCLKFLLKSNPENQKFVAELEARRTHDDSALREAGYEVEITDGNIKVKQSSTNK
jgi:ataxin-10